MYLKLRECCNLGQKVLDVREGLIKRGKLARETRLNFTSVARYLPETLVNVNGGTPAGNGVFGLVNSCLRSQLGADSNTRPPYRGRRAAKSWRTDSSAFRLSNRPNDIQRVGVRRRQKERVREGQRIDVYNGKWRVAWV